MAKEQAHLFSSDPEQRYRASCSLEGSITRTWPRGCWGAANAWLVLIGPSPGPQDSGLPAPGGSGRPWDSKITIGVSPGEVYFKSNSGRKVNWQRLARAVIGEPQHAKALVAVANLDWANSSRQGDLDRGALWSGCADVFEVLLQARPRVALALTRETWETFAEFLKRKIGGSTRLSADSLTFLLPGTDAPMLLLRSPQHPSHPMTDTHFEKVRAEVTRFLKATTTQ